MNSLIQHNSQIIIYNNKNGEIKLDVRFDGDTVWLTQKMMADLFGVGIPAVNKHLKNIFDSGELQENSVISILEITA
ncbi:cell filamentation protein Fic, partial [Patescibacteria group bacterium]|nr:cell filamentation protein Fic [Patescibacteria group bacterium]